MTRLCDVPRKGKDGAFLVCKGVRVRLCTGCDEFVCTATPDAPEMHEHCTHGRAVASWPAPPEAA